MKLSRGMFCRFHNLEWNKNKEFRGRNLHWTRLSAIEGVWGGAGHCMLSHPASPVLKSDWSTMQSSTPLTLKLQFLVGYMFSGSQKRWRSRLMTVFDILIAYSCLVLSYKTLTKPWVRDLLERSTPAFLSRAETDSNWWDTWKNAKRLLRLLEEDVPPGRFRRNERISSGRTVKIVAHF